MNREEQLKQTIEEAFPLSEGDNNYSIQAARTGCELALSTPSILRHADPEIMKEAGWEPKKQWISVQDRRPKPNDCFGNSKKIVAALPHHPDADIEYLYYYEVHPNRHSHWMPLPPKP